MYSNLSLIEWMSCYYLSKQYTNFKPLKLQFCFFFCSFSGCQKKRREKKADENDATIFSFDLSNFQKLKTAFQNHQMNTHSTLYLQREMRAKLETAKKIGQG